MPSNEYQRYIHDEVRKRKMKRIFWEIVIAVTILIPTIILCVIFERLIYKLLFSKISLSPDSEGYQNWLNPPISTTRNYYLFNITNPLEIVLDPKQETIKFQDSPPYPYNIKTNKFNVEWLDNNKTVSYDVERLYTRASTFDPNSVNDKGMFIDMVRATFRTQYQPIPDPSFYPLAGTNLFTNTSAVDLLEGFESSLFTTIRDKMMGPNTNKSGFIYRQNGSRLYSVSIKTDTFIKGQVLTFGSELVPFNITSSNYSFPIYDSLTYPANLSEHKILNIFNSDFCKPVLIEYHQTKEMFDGINMYEYRLKLVDYQNCSNPADPQTCNEVDQIDVSKCVSASLPENTIFLSKAHFYGTRNETIAQMNVEGYSPTPERHDSTLYFEPITGTPFQATYRMQLNINAMIDPMTYNEDDQTLTPLKRRAVKRLIPVFWLDQDIKIDEKVINKIRTVLRIRQYGIPIIISVAIVSIIIIVSIIEIVGRRADRQIRYTRHSYSIVDS